MSFARLTTEHITDHEKAVIKAHTSKYGGRNRIVRYPADGLTVLVGTADNEKDCDYISVDFFRYSLFVNVHVAPDRNLSDYDDAPQLIKEIVTAIFEGREIRNRKE